MLTTYLFFTILVDKEGNRKWEKMLVLVPNPFHNATKAGSLRPKQVPKGYVIVAGQPSQTKREMINAMVVDWQINLKKKNIPEGQKCPFYTISSQNILICTFFAYMRQNNSW